MGYVSWANNIATEDAITVDTLRRAGAIIYAKTTMPQSGMALECVSNLYGRTLNPFNTYLTPGGSSGGEGALIACRGSILGMGTDSGGSIRAPAAFNGLYGLKGTSSRISYKGNMNNSSGMGSASSIGPMACSIRDLKLVTKVLVNDQQWLKDSSVVAKPWNENSESNETKRLSIGLIEWDESVMPHPPIRRALEMTKNRLLEAGHEGKLFPDVTDSINIHIFLIE
jgi:amidase